MRGRRNWRVRQYWNSFRMYSGKQLIGPPYSFLAVWVDMCPLAVAKRLLYCLDDRFGVLECFVSFMACIRM